MKSLDACLERHVYAQCMKASEQGCQMHYGERGMCPAQTKKKSTYDKLIPHDSMPHNPLQNSLHI